MPTLTRLGLQYLNPTTFPRIVLLSGASRNTGSYLYLITYGSRYERRKRSDTVRSIEVAVFVVMEEETAA